ncbi:Predicted oxidoreductase [Sinomicrobium oceani]|uniref:Protein tas n=1 Tax=Sinomicrobium oceani TaxID=1150368 RepID=A0A1K1N7W1_9FLAO|nr:NADP(H)-dependent aldo-keto reductase [Sinomicrobium oceani]SFW31341.1 Predicted oxidoreductase [Sinomicrobium oceani]
MKYTTLPGTDISVSKICLGTMTWGEQNTEAEGHEQMDYALAQGVNFFDTAELYPVPARKETQGATEKIIGSWFKKNGNRDKVILASKVAGPGYSNKHIRQTGFAKEAIYEAVHASLQRLQTDYIDLYQLHWPERNTNFFGRRSYVHEKKEVWEDNFGEILGTLRELIKEGKIRHVGVSNETPYGVMRFLEESRKHDLPKMITVQNPYSLLNRVYETGLAEISMREHIGLLPYSPLAFGVLSGKYLSARPENARVTLFPNFNRYSNARATEATRSYVALAEKNGLSPAQMALAFINRQPFVTSTIIGATSMPQLKENVDSIYMELNEELVKEINAIHEQFPNPAP